MSNYNMEVFSSDLCRPEFQQSQTEIGGISSLPLSALRRTVLVASIAVVGTISPPVQEANVAPPFIEATFVYPASDAAAEDDYSRIRDEIIASGLPMLSDDEVRAEISERKANRSNFDS